ncbi:MAG: hypothetical protein Fur0042_16920 [Cyanophyceae cyanobacterium]
MTAIAIAQWLGLLRVLWVSFQQKAAIAATTTGFTPNIRPVVRGSPWKRK